MERSQASSDFVSPSLITLLSCRSKGHDRCGHAFVEASAFTDAFTNARMHVQQRCAVCGHVHECTGPYPWTHLQMHLYLHSITYAFTDLFSSAHLCCAACTYSCFLLLSSAGGGRAAGCQARTSSGPVRRAGSWNLTRACGQHQTTATKAYNWANAISWSLHWTLVWCHLSLLGNWQADQFTCCQKSEKRLTAFRETAPRKAVENTVQYHNDGVGSVVANHHGGSGNSMVVTTLIKSTFSWLTFHLSTYKIHLNYRVVHNHN